MKTNEILKELRENHFTNYNNWNTEELVDYVLSNYNCSKYVAKNVAINIKNW